MYIETFDTKKILNNFYCPNPDIESILLLLVAENTQCNLNEFINEANKRNIKVIGGVFPAIFYKTQEHKTGVIVKQLTSYHPVYTICEIHNKNHSLPKIDISSVGSNKPTVLVLVDGLSAHISCFLNGLHALIGNTVNYIGGGAGSLSLEQNPCVFSNEGVFQNAAIVAVIDWNADLKAKHGWKRIYGPLLATKTKQNIIQELNWEKPFHIYKELILQESGLQLTKENFFEIAKNYPFGITKENSEYIVRDPIEMNEKGEIVCVGEIPENTVLDLMKGEHSSLVDAAINATSESIVNHRNYQDLLIIDCISRALYMKERYTEELEGIQNIIKSNDIHLDIEGALTLGEIGSDGDGTLEFFNKTILVSLFYEKK